jgi:hypothetical protein
MTNPMHDYDSAPSGLTAEERKELAEVMNKFPWTKADRIRANELKAKLNLGNQ